ncbi:Hypothetical_protein [Hexamita inflata]|uniref:Hypothetical_protein n=1 Tax=Hexamita inflata TaxID=28002 RepID=A0AA86P5A1_9EUKA|nr:Hypothetical protein HINF_LOCUS18445 [Hexamita inflata]
MSSLEQLKQKVTIMRARQSTIQTTKQQQKQHKKQQNNKTFTINNNSLTNQLIQEGPDSGSKYQADQYQFKQIKQNQKIEVSIESSILTKTTQMQSTENRSLLVDRQNPTQFEQYMQMIKCIKTEIVNSDLFELSIQVDFTTKWNTMVVQLNLMNILQQDVLGQEFNINKFISNENNNDCLALKYIICEWNNNSGQNAKLLAEYLYKLLDVNKSVLKTLQSQYKLKDQSEEIKQFITILCSINRSLIEIEAHLIIKQMEAQNIYWKIKYPNIESLSESEFKKAILQSVKDNNIQLDDLQTQELLNTYAKRSFNSSVIVTELLQKYHQFSQVQEFQIMSSTIQCSLKNPLSTIQYSYQGVVSQFVGFYQLWCKLRVYIIRKLTENVRGIVKIYGEVKSGKTLTSMLSATFISLFLNKMQKKTHLNYKDQVRKIIFIDMSDLVDLNTSLSKLRQFAVLISNQIAPWYLKDIEKLITHKYDSHVEYNYLENIIEKMINLQSYCYHTIQLDEYQCIYSNLQDSDRRQIAVTIKRLTVKQFSCYPSTFIISGSTTVVGPRNAFLNQEEE